MRDKKYEETGSPMPTIQESLKRKKTPTSDDIEAMRMFSLIDEFEKNQKNGVVAPDTFGAEFLFIKYFVNEFMEEEFWLWANDFLKHSYSDIPELYQIREYDVSDLYRTAPDIYLQHLILGLILNSAKTGDEYAIELLKYLYKIYYKAEYNQLKRFRRITVPEIFSLAETEDGVSHVGMARILIMSSLMNIEMDEKCALLYMKMERDRARGNFDEECPDFFQFKEGLYQECSRMVEAWMENERKLPYDKQNRIFWECERFAGKCFNYNEVPEDYAYMCENGGESLKTSFTRTLALLRTTYPNREFSFEDVQRYAVLYHTIMVIVDLGTDASENAIGLLGLRSVIFSGEESDADWFKPEAVMPGRAQKKTSEKNGEEEKKRKSSVLVTNIAPVEQTGTKEEDYLREIEDLRRRLHEQEQETRHFRSMYQESRKQLEEQKAVTEVLQGDRVELIALRDYVYKESRPQEELPEVKQSEMQEELAKHKILLIGGHVNWLNKMRQNFPEWSFVNIEHATTVSSRIVENCEKVYFFTDHLSHITYGKFMNIIREKQVPFGYLNSINMESLIRYIYSDLIEERRA